MTDNSASTYTAMYAYLTNSTLVNTLTLKQSTTTRLTTTKQYDFLNRLQSISSTAYGSSAPSLPASFLYQYNDANQRTRVTLGDGSYWVYMYDKLGQVIAGNKYWQDGTPVDGQQFNYGFDDIGNRTATGGRASAASAYTRNRLNQYSQRTVAGVVDVLGVANPTSGVTVNGNTANRRGDYFHWPLTVNNASAAQYPTITVVSQYGSTQTSSGAAFVPTATESYTYDTDGNVTADGRWNYTWDAENRLIEMKRDTSTPTLSSRLRATFEYDHQGRRIRKTYYTHNGSTWVEQTDTVFLYDVWNLMGELDANNSNNKLRTYIWGLDLSGKQASLLEGARGGLQGADGVGGLVKVTDYTSGTTHHFVAYDGNGNVSALIDGSTGAATARYEFGPFGEAIRTTGTLAKKNPLRFSTKYIDDESGHLYYGFRYYNPSSGRWLGRDPAGEDTGEVNLYGFVSNDPLDSVDGLGLMQWRDIEHKVKSLNIALADFKCCCTKSEVSKVDITIAGKSSGSTVTATATIKKQGCVEGIYSQYWWDCYSAAAERNPWFHNDWKNWGWSQGGETYSKTAVPGFFAPLSFFDPYHLAMSSAVIFIYCGRDGGYHARSTISNELIWTWNKKTKSWTGPSSSE